MKRLLLSLCVVGAVFPGFPSNLLRTRSPSASAERTVRAEALARLPDRLMLKSIPEPGPWFEQVAVRSPATTEENTPSTSLPPKDSQSSPLPTAREDSEPAGPMTPE